MPCGAVKFCVKFCVTFYERDTSLERKIKRAERGFLCKVLLHASDVLNSETTMTAEFSAVKYWRQDGVILILIR